MRGEVLVGRVDLRFVPVGLEHAGLRCRARSAARRRRRRGLARDAQISPAASASRSPRRRCSSTRPARRRRPGRCGPRRCGRRPARRSGRWAQNYTKTGTRVVLKLVAMQINVRKFLRLLDGRATSSVAHQGGYKCTILKPKIAGETHCPFEKRRLDLVFLKHFSGS